jgi:hypothetical protein
MSNKLAQLKQKMPAARWWRAGVGGQTGGSYKP